MRNKEQLLVGDCTKRLAEIEDGAVDLVLTDPPYNTGMTARNATRLQNFFHDAYAPEDYRTLARTVARECYRILKDDRACYVFMNWRSLGVWLDALSAAGFRLKNLIVWDKVVPGLNSQNYAHTQELLISRRRDASCRATKEPATTRAATCGASGARRGMHAPRSSTTRR
jgi:DNA modification methylase